MSAVALGLLAAICWGTADFAARFTGRALGAAAALLGVMLAGAAELAVWLGASGRPIPSPLDLSGWAAAAAVSVVAAMLLFYEALRRGPVAVVVPLAGAYPAWALAIGLLFDGVIPSPAPLAAMAAIMAGAWTVARFSPSDGAAADRLVVPLALAAGLAFALAFRVGARAIEIHGQTEILWHARWLGAAVLLLVPAARRVGSRRALRWLPVLAVQGGLDTLGIALVLAAQTDENAASATVVSSTFGVVTILLALAVLNERVHSRQWAGMALVFGGVAALAGLTAG